MRTLLLLPVLAVAVCAIAGGAAAAAPLATPGVSAAPRARAVVVIGQHAPRPVTAPSTFAMGVATLAGFGYAYWRRRRFLADTAAL